MDDAQPDAAGRLLLVDDEENILRSLRRCLQRGRWEIETATSGEAALACYERFRPEVVVSDYYMPGISGVELLARFKEIAPKTQRILLTGQADQQAMEDAINRSEIFRFVGKPWNDAQLLLTVRSAFEQHQLQLDHERLTRLAAEQNGELRALNARLETLNAELEDRVLTRTGELERAIEAERTIMARAIENEKMVAIGHLAGGVAHEINNPLGAILAFVQLMQRDRGRSEADLESLGLIEESALRCKRIVTSLLKFSRRPRLEDRRPFSLNRCVEDAVMLFSAQLAKSPGVRFDVHLADSLPDIDGDAQQLGQVLLNLFHNGLQALPGGVGSLGVVTGRDSAGVFVTVSDTGTGIDAAPLPHIFEPHFTTKPPGVGTGLGLAIAYRIVEDLGGHFAVESRPSEGSRFSVHIPSSSE